MSHPLNEKIDALRARVRRLVLVHGLSAVLATVLGAAIVLGLADYLLRFQDRGIRVISSLVLLGLVSWSAYRFLYRPLFARLRDVGLALRLQERFPQLGDRLVSAVEFLRQAEDDRSAGSAALRRAVIAQAASESERLDFSTALDRRPMLHSASVAAAAVLLASLMVTLDPSSSRTALARLAGPFGNTAWPQVTHLELREVVTRVARGQPFEVEAVDAHDVPLPSEVRIQYRFEGPAGVKTVEVERMQWLGGAMTARRENVTRPFEYRVEGGDDRDMEWIAVEVIDPPALQSLAITLFPPEHTGWAVERLANGGDLRALVGTRVRFEAAVTRPISAAALRLEGGADIPAELSEDGLRLVIDGFVVEKSGVYWFRLTDREGPASDIDSRWAIRAVPDSPPTVAIEQPTSNLFVTPRAVVPLRIAAKDDLALREVRIVYSRSDQADPKEATISLYAGPRRLPTQPAGPLSSGAELGERRAIDYRWELEGMKFSPGAQIAFHAAAADYGAQIGKSEPRRLSVITPEELQDRIASRQNLIVQELARVLKMQRDARAQVQSLEIRLRELGALEQLDLDHLQAAEMGQRQVGRSLSSRSEGVVMHVLALLADLKNNRVDAPDIERRMQSLLDEIGRLDRDCLPPLGRELTAAIKSAQFRLEEEVSAGVGGTKDGKRARSARSTTPDSATAVALAKAGRHQDEVIASLEALLGQLKQWDDYRRFHRDLAQLRRDQEELAKNSADVGRSTLTKELKDLAPQELADLKVHAGRQLELARRLSRLEQDMDAAVGELRASDPLAADTVTDAVAESRRLGIGAAMRAAAAQLQDNRIGQVAGAHKQIAQGLQDVLDILANRRQNELARLVTKLREAEADLHSLKRRQGELRVEMEKAAKEPDAARRKAELDRLGRRQQALREEAQRMARRLERLMAEQAGQTVQQAADQMDQAGDSAGKDGAAALRQAGEAENTLGEAIKQLAERRLQAQVELAMEQLARLEDAIKHLRNQQQNVLGETQRLSLLEAKGPLSRAQTASLHDLARLQQSLQAETSRLAEQMAGAGGFRLALSGAQGDMGRAAALLDRRETGPSTQQAEQSALARLELVLKAVEPESPNAKPEGKGGGPGDAGGNQALPGGVQTLAELKLLRLMQEDLNLRTRKLQEERAAKEPTQEQRRQYDVLSAEQGRLADLVMQMLQPVEAAPEEEVP